MIFDESIRVNITDASAAIASQTTTREDFKSWNSTPSHPFTEMPPVVGKNFKCSIDFF